MLVIIILMIVGLVLIIKGGDWFVDAASWIAEVSGIPKLIVGATVVSFATTMPELLVSAFAAAGGNVDVSIGNAIGSVTANIGLIMGISLLFIPSVINRKDYLFKGIMMLGSAILLFLLSFSGELKMLPSLLLLVMFALFMSDNVKGALDTMKKTKEANKSAVKKTDGKTIALNILKFVVGVASIIVGARLLVDNGTALAEKLGVSDRIIAVTIIAVGTSLPELVTTISAIVKKQSELSVGNIIGANIIDLTLILPMSALISGGSLKAETRSAVLVDMPVMIFLGAIALIPSLITKKFHRWQGALILVLYITYSVLTCMGVLSI